MENKTSIEDWVKCCHTKKVLLKADIKTMEQLNRMSYEDLIRLRGIGPVIAGDLQKITKEWADSQLKPAHSR